MDPPCRIERLQCEMDVLRAYGAASGDVRIACECEEEARDFSTAPDGWFALRCKLALPLLL